MRHYATNRRVAGSILNGVTGIDMILQYGPGVDSVSNIKEYQDYSLER